MSKYVFYFLNKIFFNLYFFIQLAKLMESSSSSSKLNNLSNDSTECKVNNRSDDTSFNNNTNNSRRSSSVVNMLKNFFSKNRTISSETRKDNLSIKTEDNKLDIENSTLNVNLDDDLMNSLINDTKMDDLIKYDLNNNPSHCLDMNTRQIQDTVCNETSLIFNLDSNSSSQNNQMLNNMNITSNDELFVDYPFYELQRVENIDSVDMSKTEFFLDHQTNFSQTNNQISSPQSIHTSPSVSPSLSPSSYCSSNYSISAPSSFLMYPNPSKYRLKVESHNNNTNIIDTLQQNSVPKYFERTAKNINDLKVC